MNRTQFISHSTLSVLFIFCAASDKQTLLSNDQLYQVREGGVKETLLQFGVKFGGVGETSYLEDTVQIRNYLGHTRWLHSYPLSRTDERKRRVERDWGQDLVRKSWRTRWQGHTKKLYTEPPFPLVLSPPPGQGSTHAKGLHVKKHSINMHQINSERGRKDEFMTVLSFLAPQGSGKWPLQPPSRKTIEEKLNSGLKVGVFFYTNSKKLPFLYLPFQLLPSLSPFPNQL